MARKISLYRVTKAVKAAYHVDTTEARNIACEYINNYQLKAA